MTIKEIKEEIEEVENQLFYLAMKDNWNRQEFERLERNGYSTRYAIEYMIEHNIIKL